MGHLEANLVVLNPANDLFVFASFFNCSPVIPKCDDTYM